MNLQDLSIKDFLAKTAGSDPVPGGGSIAALCGTLAAALAEMVTGLTIGRKKYADVQAEMEAIAPRMADARAKFLDYIDKDAQAYDAVFAAFKMPKDTDEQREIRAAAIEGTTLYAATVPLAVANLAVDIMPDIAEIAEKGNKNAITDACVAMMTARTAALGAILNVRINIAGLTNTTDADVFAEQCDVLQALAIERESALLSSVKL